MRSAFVGIDMGTSGCKVVALSEGGALLASSWEPVESSFGRDGSATQRPADWLNSLRLGVRRCVSLLGGRRVEGIGVTAPAHVAVLTSATGRALAPALLAFDARPEATAAGLRQRYGAHLFETTFVELTAGWTLAQLDWLRVDRPDIWPRIRWILPQKDWIRYSLTGEALVDPSDAAGMALLDQRSQAWLEPIVADLGLDLGQFPRVVSSTAPGGVLTRRWARELDVPAGTPIVVGATDTAAELVSVGAIEEGASIVKIATTGTVVAVTDRPSPTPGLMTYPHAVPRRWYTLAATNAAAAAYAWLRDVLTPGGDQAAYGDLDRLASSVPAGAAGALFVPFLRGERTPYWDPALRGAFLGLTSRHGRADLARAVLEGVAYSLRDCRDMMAASGFGIRRPFLTGGGQRSELWRQILVSVLRTSGTVRGIHGPAIGAAMLAMADETSTAHRIASLVSPSGDIRVRPIRSWADQYDQGYNVYREAVSLIAPISHSLTQGERQADA